MSSFFTSIDHWQWFVLMNNIIFLFDHDFCFRNYSTKEKIFSNFPVDCNERLTRRNFHRAISIWKFSFLKWIFCWLHQFQRASSTSNCYSVWIFNQNHWNDETRKSATFPPKNSTRVHCLHRHWIIFLMISELIRQLWCFCSCQCEIHFYFDSTRK